VTTQRDAVAGYVFGDSALAARRLGLLAEVFEPTSRAFLADAGAQLAGPGPLELAVDLGCGPGHTTRLLVSVLGARRTLGLDQPAFFVALAAEDPPPGASFAVHDVTAVPFPCRDAGMRSAPGSPAARPAGAGPPPGPDRRRVAGMIAWDLRQQAFQRA
jgi:hypothetical protein